mgnify:CR=1 FL=1
MSNYCPHCFGEMDALHFCSESESSTQSKNSNRPNLNNGEALATLLVVGPFAGFLLDLVIPLPSSLIHSILLSIAGSGLAAVIWTSINFKGQKSFKFFFFNIRNFLYTPNLFKIFDGHNRSNKNVVKNNTYLSNIVLELSYMHGIMW